MFELFGSRTTRHKLVRDFKFALEFGSNFAIERHIPTMGAQLSLFTCLQASSHVQQFFDVHLRANFESALSARMIGMRNVSISSQTFCRGSSST
jgi:hypothetical protein